MTYIQNWQPDVILFMEMFRESQLKNESSEIGGPVLPPGYDGTYHNVNAFFR